MKILILPFVLKIKTCKVTRAHHFTLVKGQSRLYVGKYSFTHRILLVKNTFSNDRVHASSGKIPLE